MGRKIKKEEGEADLQGNFSNLLTVVADTVVLTTITVHVISIAHGRDRTRYRELGDGIGKGEDGAGDRAGMGWD